MRTLFDLQQSFARAMTTGDGAALAGHLTGGSNPAARIVIHFRHYETSLANALCDKFPATVWLVGADLVRRAASRYARLHPPLQPSISEYGREFPQFLSQHLRSAPLPYLESFAQLEWLVGQASISIDEPPLIWPEVAELGVERIVATTVALQPGVRYVRSAWRIDDLLQTYVSGTPPERFILHEGSTLLEVQGARGNFRLTRLEPATFAFRSALAESRTIGEAADTALVIDPTFDAGYGLRALVEAGLSIGYWSREQEACT